MTKQYDREYFQRWYHDPGTRIRSGRSLERTVHLAVSAAEYLLGRRLRTVLDVGCGEAPWYGVLRSLRPRIDYVGVDSSDYAVRAARRTGRVRYGTFGGLRALRLSPGIDLIVCADVLQYVPTAELGPGLREIRRLLGGVAFLEAYTRDDDMEGDMEGWHVRSAASYRRHFRAAGLTHCGLNCFINRATLGGVNQLELCTSRPVGP
jgi:SAM-dependent methyltransferase